MVLLLPPAAPQGLIEEIANPRFQRLIITIDDERVVIEGQRSPLSTNASRLMRQCLDDPQDCPQGGARLSAGNADGTVTGEEVAAFSRNARDTINTAVLVSPDLQALMAQLRSIITIDGSRPTSPTFTGVMLDGAQGSVTSTATIYLTASLEALFDGLEGGSHRVQMARNELTLSIADRIEIHAGDGWRIVEGSIEPADMQKYHQDGSIKGTQSQFESDRPLVFEIESTGIPAWVWWLVGGLLLLLAAAGLVWYLLTRRTESPKASPR